MTARYGTAEFHALVAAAKAGDAVALNDLFGRVLPSIRAFIRVRAGRVLRERESVDDLAQSVCREMLADLAGFEYRGEAALHSWLALLASRKILQRQRFHAQERRDLRREVALATPSELGPEDAATVITALGRGPTPSQVAVAHEQARRIERALAALPDNQRDAVTMSRLLGLPYGEIAAELSCTESAARGLTFRGLAALAAALGAAAPE